MSFTSNWIWDSVNKVLDVNVGSGGTRTTRNNWAATRHRFTDVDFPSELGNETEVLSAYMAGEIVNERIGDPNHITFGTTRNWTDTAYKYNALYDYFRRYWNGGGTPQFFYKIEDDVLNLPDNSKTTIVRPRLRWDSGAEKWWWWWEAGEWSKTTTDWFPSDIPSVTRTVTTGMTLTGVTVDPNATPQQWQIILNGTCPDADRYQVRGSVYGVYSSCEAEGTVTVPGEIEFTFAKVSGSTIHIYVGMMPDDTTPTNYIKTAEVDGGTGEYGVVTSPPAIDTQAFITAVGTFSGASTAADAGLAQPTNYYCSSDVTSYKQAEPWKTQTQTWIYKDEYV